jgi:hypothetical protein
VAITKMELLDLVRNAQGGDVDFLREGVRVLAQALMDAEVSAQIARSSASAPPSAAHPYYELYRLVQRVYNPGGLSGSAPSSGRRGMSSCRRSGFGRL